MLTSSAGRRATNKVLQLLLSSNTCPHALLLGQIVVAFAHPHATANETSGSVFSLHRTNIGTIPVMRFTSLCPVCQMKVD